MSKNKAISSYLEDYYWYWFCNIPRIGKTKLRQLLMVFESPEHVYKADVEVLRGLGLLSDKELMYISDSKKDNMIYEEFISIRKEGRASKARKGPKVTPETPARRVPQVRMASASPR